MKSTICALAIAVAIAGTLYASDDPFCGKWKLNLEKSNVTGEQMKMQDLGGNKLKFSNGNFSDTVTTDGTDQPIHNGETMSITPQASNSFKMVIKKDGRLLSSMIHSLSEDGQTQTIKGTDYRPDGTTTPFEFVDKRVGAGSGWTGTWEITKFTLNAPEEFEFEPNGDNGLTLKSPADKETLAFKFDGKDYPDEGPNVAPGSMSSAKRIDDHQFEMVSKVKGKVTDRANFKVDLDGKTLTITFHDTGQPKPVTAVYDKAS